MSNVMKYKGYAARVEFHDEDGVLVGTVLDVADVISFHGESVRELRSAFHAAIDHYLADSQATGRNPRRS